ncbi:unnamed protein product [Colias eurytheme]|nr:unnamed protein product [Colias eurytheme]
MSDLIDFVDYARRHQPEKEELCFKHSCVTLSNGRRSCVPINANYINGFKDRKAYIATRTPNSETATCNFWRMIWQHQTEVVVMLDQPGKNQDSTSFLDPDEESSLQFGKLNIKRFRVHQNQPSVVIMRAVVTHEDGGTLNVNYFLFKNWQRQDVSPLECDLLDLISMTRLYNKLAVTPELRKGYESYSSPLQ